MKITGMLCVLWVSMCVYGEQFRLTPEDNLEEVFIETNPGDTLVLAAGNYAGSITIPQEVLLMGENPYTTHIQGNNRNPVITAGYGAHIRNISVSQGRNGIFVRNRDVTISNCIIKNNRLSGILAINHLPGVDNTVFFNNGGNGITGNAITSSPAHSNLSFIQNDNHAIKIETNTPVTMTKSLFYNNGRDHLAASADNIEITSSLFYPESDTADQTNIFTEPKFQSLRRRNTDFRCRNKPDYGVTFLPAEAK
ncbi:MAG: right-handed parallel beta-helix repeat-containing protein [Fibrobacterota bacterium]